MPTILPPSSDDSFESIRDAIIADEMNIAMRDKGYVPVYTAGSKAKIVIVGQAPGTKAQLTQTPWNDASGRLLRQWLGLSDEQFYDPDIVAIVPMDFYYPGKGVHGDLPPRKGFAEKWHTQLFALMPDVELVILIGAYAQKHYLGKSAKRNLTLTVQAYTEYLPNSFPLVHPSPLTIRWRKLNPWFEQVVVPELQARIKAILER